MMFKLKNFFGALHKSQENYLENVKQILSVGIYPLFESMCALHKAELANRTSVQHLLNSKDKTMGAIHIILERLIRKNIIHNPFPDKDLPEGFIGNLYDLLVGLLLANSVMVMNDSFKNSDKSQLKDLIVQLDIFIKSDPFIQRAFEVQPIFWPQIKSFEKCSEDAFSRTKELVLQKQINDELLWWSHAGDTTEYIMDLPDKSQSTSEEAQQQSHRSPHF